uniref:Prostaglandin E synthase 3 n=1 Tax=Labrus bergylta TaxID=56723 RepID=A0A3Q3G207_9LABR
MRDSVFIEFCVADSKDLKINFDKTKCVFSCIGGTDNVKIENEIDLFEAIDENESKHKRTDRSVLCYLRKAQPGKAWPRLTKEKAKLSWLSVDFNNWRDWEDDSEEEMGQFDQFSDMMHNMGGDDDLPDLDGAEDVNIYFLLSLLFMSANICLYQCSRLRLSSFLSELRLIILLKVTFQTSSPPLSL